jgi:hypothetical protein
VLHLSGMRALIGTGIPLLTEKVGPPRLMRRHGFEHEHSLKGSQRMLGD